MTKSSDSMIDGSVAAMLKPSRILSQLTGFGMQQVMNILYPLMLLPIVARMLQPHDFGVLVFFQSLGTWGAITIIYGLHLIGTRSILLDTDKSAEIAGTIWSTQIAISLLLLTTLYGAAYFYPMFSAHPHLLLMAWISSSLQAFVPVWYFRAAQRVNTLATFEIVPKLCSLPILAFMLWLVPTPSTAMLVFVLTTLTTCALASRATLRAIGRVRVSVAGVKAKLASAFPIFFSDVAYNINSLGAIVILGLFVSEVQLGYFGSAERIIRASTGLMSIVPQAVFPILVTVLKHGEREAGRTRPVVLGSAAAVVFLGLAGGSLLYFLSDHIIIIAFGTEFAASAEILRAMSLLPTVYGLAYITGLHGLVARGMNVSLAITVACGAVVNLTLAVTLTPAYGPIGMVITMYAGVLTTVLLQAGILFHRRNGAPAL